MQPRPGWLPHKLSVGLLTLIGGVTYTAFYQPILFSDDWSYLVMPMVQHSATWLSVADRRPLVNAPVMILQSLVEINVDAWYLIAWLVTMAVAWSVYWVAQQLLPPRLRYVALLVAALTLVYPADLSEMWLTHTLLGRVAWLLTLVAIRALIAFIERRRYAYLVVATLLAGLAPLMYEAALGVLLAVCGLLVLTRRMTPWRDRRWVLLPAGLNVAYMVWRSLGYNLVGIDDPYLTEITLDIGRLADRLILGFKSLLWAWTEPVRGWLGLLNNGEAAWLIIAVIGGVWGVVWLFTQNWPLRTAEVTARREWLGLFGVGVALACAGYFPILILYEPNLDSINSRVNIWAIPGTALCVVSSLALVAQWLTRGHTTRFHWLVGAGVAVLVGIGITTQLTVRVAAVTAWQEQTHVWHDLFEVAPQLTDDTAVYFVLPGYGDRLGYVNTQRLPLSNSWEATAALNVLYDQTTLHGDVLLPDTVTLGEPELTPGGIRDFVTGRVIPYSAAVFVTYAGTPRHVRLITDLSRELNLAWPTPDYAPNRHLVRTPPAPIELRRFVAMGALMHSAVSNGE